MSGIDLYLEDEVSNEYNTTDPLSPGDPPSSGLTFYTESGELDELLTPDEIGLLHQQSQGSPQKKVDVEEKDVVVERPPLTLTGEEVDLLLDAPVPLGKIIDTRDVSVRVDFELKCSPLSRNDFVRTVAGNSVGALEALLRDPKPWKTMSSERRAYQRMYNWLHLSLEQRNAVLKAEPLMQNLAKRSGLASKHFNTFITEDKKEILKKALREAYYPTKETKRKLARDLEITPNQVEKFLMNERMRSQELQETPDPDDIPLNFAVQNPMDISLHSI